MCYNLFGSIGCKKGFEKNSGKLMLVYKSRNDRRELVLKIYYAFTLLFHFSFRFSFQGVGDFGDRSAESVTCFHGTTFGGNKEMCCVRRFFAQYAPSRIAGEYSF